MLFLGASIAGEAEKSLPLMAYVMTIHSMYFALLHFLGSVGLGLAEGRSFNFEGFVSQNWNV